MASAPKGQPLSWGNKCVTFTCVETCTETWRVPVAGDSTAFQSLSVLCSSLQLPITQFPFWLVSL